MESDLPLDIHSLRLARNTGWLAAGGVISALLTAGLTAVTARMLGSSSFGELALAVATTAVVMQFADFRTWEVAVRLVPTSAPGILSPESGPVILGLLLTDLGAGLIGMAATWLLASGVGALGQSSAVSDLMRTYAFAVPWIVLSSGTCVGVLRLGDQFRLLMIKSVTISVVQFGVVVATLARGQGVAGVVTAYVIVEVVNALATLLIVSGFLRRIGLSLPRSWSRIAKSLTLGRPLLGQMWLSGTIKGLLTRLDIPLLGFLSTPTAVAHYRLAQDLAGVMTKLGNPIQHAILPEMVALDQQGDRGGLRRLAGFTTLALAIPLLPALVIAALFSRTILRLAAGVEFAAAGPVFAVVAIGIAVNTMLVWSRPLLVARMRVGWGNAIAVIGGLIQLGAIAGFARDRGALAAAAGNAMMLLLSSVAGAVVGLR